MVFVPCLSRVQGEAPRLGEPLLDEYLRFVAARARPNTVLAQSYDLKVFFTVVAAAPSQVSTADVLRFIEAQRKPRHGNVVRLVDGESGMAASTIKRRLATVSSLFDYLAARGVVARNPVPRSLSARPGRAPLRGSPLVRAPRRLPRVLSPDEVDRLVAALRTDRDRAMAWLMLLGGLRRCEVLGLSAYDLTCRLWYDLTCRSRHG
jgi:integrase/recombinase XerD